MGDKAIKDITANTFGWTIAFVLPGLLTIFTIAFWSTNVSGHLAAFSNAPTTLGLTVLGLLTSLLAGLLVSAVRWAIYEEVSCRHLRLPPAAFAKLQASESAFRTIVDEHYKYHQFLGGVSIVIPFFFWGLLQSEGVKFCSTQGLLLTLAGSCIELITIWAARETYKKYVDRATAILKG